MTEPLRISVELADEIACRIPLDGNQAIVEELIDRRLQPLVDLLRRARGMLDATGYRSTSPTIMEIDAALKDAGAE